MSDLPQTDYIPASPYPGIGPFTYSHRNLLFARDAEAQTLTRRIVMYRGVLLYADSGTGKSSLVNAGMIPLAIGEGYQPEKVRVQPLIDAEIIVERLSEKVEGEPPFLPSIFTLDEKRERVVLSVDRFLTVLREKVGTVRPLLIFDQFREWVTLFEESVTGKAGEAAREAQTRIRDTIVSLVNNERLPVKLLISLREDYLAKLSPFFERCPSLPDQYLRLTALNGQQIYRAIRGPFEKFPGKYYPELTPSLAEKVKHQFEERSGAGDIRLTEVQIVCQSLFETGKQGQAPEKQFANGGVQGVLERYLEQAIGSLQEEQREAAVGLLSRLVTPAGTRNVISRDDLLGRVAIEDQIPSEFLAATLDDLDRKTMLVRRERRREVYYYEITSEFLVDWIRKKAREAETERQRRDLEAAKKSAEERRQKLDEQVKTSRRLRRLTIGFALLFVAAAVSAFFAWNQRMKAEEATKKAQNSETKALLAGIDARETEKLAVGQQVLAWDGKKREEAERKKAEEQTKLAEQHARRNTSLRLAAAAVDNLNIDPELSLLLVLQAGSVANTAEAEDVLRRAMQAPRVKLTLGDRGPQVNSVTFSRDGKFLATAGGDRTARIWDAATGEKQLTLSGHGNAVNSIAFSPDGQRVATAGGDRTARIWDAATGEPLRTLSGHGSAVNSIAFSPDGQRVATAGGDSTARIWDAATGEPLRTLSGHGSAVNSIAFSPDGQRVATAGGDRTARIWDAATGEPLRTLSGHESAVNSIAFSPDGQRVATAGGDRTARIWDAATGEKQLTLSGHGNAVNSIAFSPDGQRVVTGSFDKVVKMWDALNAEELLNIVGHRDGIRGVAFSPDGRHIASSSEDGTARIWDVTSTEILTLAGHRGLVMSVAFSRDGRRLISGSFDNTAKLWDARTGQALLTLSGHKNRVMSVAFSPDSARVATASFDNTAKLWDAATGHVLLTFAHKKPVRSVAFSPDGRHVATASYDHSVKLWDAMTGNEIRTLSGHNEEAWSVAFSPDGKRLATGSKDTTVKLWEIGSGRHLLTLEGHNGGVTNIAFSLDGKRLATASLDKTGRVWEVATGKPLVILSGHGNSVWSIVFTPDGGRLATASEDKTVRFWDAINGRHLYTFRSQQRAVNSVAFSQDGRRFMTAGDDHSVRAYPYNLQELVSLVRPQLTRSLTSEECKYHLAVANCPPSVRALALFIEANGLARRGNFNGSKVAFKKAQQLDPSLRLDVAAEFIRIPVKERLRGALREAEEKRLAGQRLFDEGRNLAGSGDLKLAAESFRKAQQLNTSLNVDPEAEARRLRADRLLAEGGLLVRQGRVSQAITNYEQTTLVDPILKIPARELNTLCWFGSLWNNAETVLKYCKQAVELEPDNWEYRDSRGLARALTGETIGAIEDFQAFVDGTDNKERRQQRQRWIEALGADQNPFTSEVLKSLFGQ